MKSSIVNLVESTCKFCFIKGNRDYVINRELKKSIDSDGIYLPIIVIKAKELKGCTFIDADSAEPINGSLANYWAIIDGQHRYKSIKSLYEEAIKAKKGISDKIKVFPINEYSLEEIGGNVNKFMTVINSTSKNWEGKDYVNNANIVKNDELTNTIAKFQEYGMKLTSISLFLTLKKYKLTKQSLSNYTNDNEKIEGADCVRAKKLYKFFKDKGFSEEFLAKRYLIEYVANAAKSSNFGISESLCYINYCNCNKELSMLTAPQSDVLSELSKRLQKGFDDYLNEHNITDKKDIDELKKKDYLANVDLNDEPKGNGTEEEGVEEKKKELLTGSEIPTPRLSTNVEVIETANLEEKEKEVEEKVVA